MFSKYRTGLESSTDEQAVRNRQAVVENVEQAVHTLIDTVFPQDKNVDRASLGRQIQGIILQEALLSDARTQSDRNKQSDDQVQKLFGPKYKEILEKIAKLQEKWREADDSEEKRDMCNLLFTDCSMLGKSGLSILADNLTMYKEHGWEEGKYWKRHLDLAALSGSREIGDFIIENKNAIFTNQDYEYVLGYIASSFNGEWAIDFAKKMKEKGILMPDSIYSFCDDFDLTQNIETVFSEKQRSTPL